MEAVSVKRHSVFLGASGSGKTELSINFAINTSGLTDRKVSFFDMDQTKGLFRSRDFYEEMAGYGIETVEPYDFQDAPVVPAGVVSKINDPGSICVFDVGGNAAGAVMIGQFTGRMTPADTDYFYVINPCRPFMDTREDIEQSMVSILSASRVDPAWIKIVSNPNMGRKTTAAIILESHERLKALLEGLGMKISLLCADRGLAGEVKGSADVPIIPLRLFLRSLY